jgi:hypothetical protein
LYSYLFFGDKGPSSQNTQIATIKAYLADFSVYREAVQDFIPEQMNGFFLPTNEDAEWIDRCDTRPFKSIKESSGENLVPVWECKEKNKPGEWDLDKLANWLLAKYDYARSAYVLDNLKKQAVISRTDGIWVITSKLPLLKNSSIGGVVLTQDLSRVPPNYINIWVRLLRSQFASPTDWDTNTLYFKVLWCRQTLPEVARLVEIGVAIAGEPFQDLISLIKGKPGELKGKPADDPVKR